MTDITSVMTNDTGGWSDIIVSHAGHLLLGRDGKKSGEVNKLSLLLPVPFLPLAVGGWGWKCLWVACLWHVGVVPTAELLSLHLPSLPMCVLWSPCKSQAGHAQYPAAPPPKAFQCLWSAV